MAGFEILGIGTPIIDHIIHASDSFMERLPGKKGGMVPIDLKTFENILSSSEAPDLRFPGGSGANVIRGLASLGHCCGLIGKIGTDAAADFLIKEFLELKIKPLLLNAKSPTAQVISLVDPHGQRTMRALLSASSEMTAEDLDPKLFAGVRLVHIEGYALLNGNLAQRAMQLAKEAGALVSFDVGSFEVVQKYRAHILELLERYVDIIFANELETPALTHQQDLREGCKILQQDRGIAVVMRGKEGAFLAYPGGVFESDNFPVEEPLDTTGAGDFFAAGFLHGFLSGWPLERAARLGAELGAACVQVLGAEVPEEVWEQVKKQDGKDRKDDF